MFLMNICLANSTVQSKAFDFDDDHLYAFYINGNRRTGQPIYCMDVQDERKTTEETHIDDLRLYKGQKLYYLLIWRYVGI